MGPLEAGAVCGSHQVRLGQRGRCLTLFCAKMPTMVGHPLLSIHGWVGGRQMVQQAARESASCRASGLAFATVSALHSLCGETLRVNKASRDMA
jgi:hypothetical protein